MCGGVLPEPGHAPMQLSLDVGLHVAPFLRLRDLRAMPTPATHAILAQLKAGEIVYQAGELPETLRVYKIVLIINALNY